MKQKSLLSFFGKPKKKLKLDDTRSTSQHGANDTKIGSKSTSKKQDQTDVSTEETICCNKSSSCNDDSLVTEELAEVMSSSIEEEQNDTDSTQSRESDDSNSSSDDGEDNDDDVEDEVDHTTSINGSNPYQKSEYELLRERNIARNNARLKALGLLVPSSDSNTYSKKKQQRKRSSVAKVTSKTNFAEPKRRSSRLSGAKMNHSDESGQEGVSLENVKVTATIDEVVEEEKFKVSPLFDYQMNDGGTSPTAETSSKQYCNGSSRSGQIKSLVPSGKRLVPPAGLSAIYSLQFYNTHASVTEPPSPWIVGAGKAGLIAVWDCNNKSKTTQEDQISYVDPVLSWKGHGGRWIADARFLPAVATSNISIPRRLVTAGNDGTVCLWDLSSTSLTTGAPRLSHRTNKSLHSSGIFSMDVKIQQDDCLIVTGSKDKSIAVSTLSQLSRDDGPSWRSHFHTGKVSCVSFSSLTMNLIASASDDSLVAIHDMRQSGLDSNGIVACLEDSHVRPHSAVWMPSSDSKFLTAGLDDVIKLWDVRNTRKPILSMHGHVPASGKKLKRIHRPSFFSCVSDSFILSGGENSHSISMFQLDEDVNSMSADLCSVTSRGKLPDGCGDVGSMAVQSNQIAVTVEGGEVIVLTPQS